MGERVAATNIAGNNHAALDRAVWAACGWLAEVTEDVILSRPMALSGARAGNRP